MELLGTITKYYPFIDQETESILNSLMEESGNYFDFVHRLAKTVLEKEAPDNTVYIAAAHCWYVAEKDLINAIVGKYRSLVSIKPWIFQWGTSESFHLENYQAILESLEIVEKLPAENWIIAELLLGHSFNLAVRSESVNILSTAKAILRRQPDLLCFKPMEYIAEGHLNYQEGKISSAAASCRKGFELAVTNNDVVFEFFSILSLATYVKNTNPKESLELHEQAYQIAQALGVPVFVAEVLHSSSSAYEILGEYDLAISSETECLNEFNVFGNEIPCSTLSRLYAALGDGRRALKWAERVLEDREYHMGYLDKARALIILNRLDEAEMFLDIAGQKVLQVGNDDYLARYNFVSGLFEMAKGEYANSMATLEQAYEIHYPLEKLVYLNETLVALARAESTLLLKSQGRDEAGSGKWLSTFENHARKFDMPGIAMQAALFRSEIFKSQGQLQDAHETLQRALELSDSPGVKTLRMRIKARILEIDRLIHDEGVLS